MKKRILVTSPNKRITAIFFLQNNILYQMKDDYDFYFCLDMDKKTSDYDLLEYAGFKKKFEYKCSKRRKRISSLQLFANTLGGRKLLNSGVIVYNMMGKSYGRLPVRFLHRLLGVSRLTARIANYVLEKYAGLNNELKNIIVDIKPDLIITFLKGSEPLGTESIKAGKLCKIPVLGLQYGWDNLSIRGMLPFNPDYMGVWGYQSRIHAEKLHRMPTERVFHIGAIFTDIFKKPITNSEIEIREKLQLPQNKKIIFFAGNIWAFNEVRNLRLLENAIGEGMLQDCCVLYRPHPFQKRPKNDLNYFEQNFRHVYLDPAFKEQYKNAISNNDSFKTSNKSIGINFEYLRDIFSISSIVVSAHSSVIIEGAAFGIPSIDIVYTDNANKRFRKWFDVDHLSVLRSLPGVFVCFRPSDLENTCIKALQYSEDDLNIQIMKAHSIFAVHNDNNTFSNRLQVAIDTILEKDKSSLFAYLKNPLYAERKEIFKDSYGTEK